MRRTVPVWTLILGLILVSGCGLSPKDSVLKRPTPSKDPFGNVDAGKLENALSLGADSSSFYFSEAEELYAQGVAANQESNWERAQDRFEKALEILYLMEIGESDSLQVDRFNRLLREIAYDYKSTLVYLGELADDSSQNVFLEQFYDMHTFKSQDFAAKPESGVTDAENEFGDSTLPEPQPDEITHDVPLEWNWRVKKQLEYLTSGERIRFQDYLHRSGKYIELMTPIIKEKGLPLDLVYLPLIESGFNPKAYSWAHASGPWQFISSTGKKYGLGRNWWYDERRDFIKSTEAACDYLKYLYGLFGDWNLALAAYNGGEGRIGRTIKKQKTADFWKMDLRKQTEDYVPRYMAAVMIAKEPEKYGFQTPQSMVLEFEVVEIKHCLDLREVARKLEIDLVILRELNPELLRDVTPPGFSRYELRIPAGKSDLFWTLYEDLSAKGANVFAQHKVRKGESLGKIAKRYGITASALADLNNISTRKALRAGQYLTVPIQAKSGASTGYFPGSQSIAKTNAGSYFTYTVRRNDNLVKLAKQYGTTISALREINGFSRRRVLYAGEKIKIPGSSHKNSIDKLADNLIIHIVRDGDTLWKIAQNYGTTWKSILAWNQLQRGENIKPGQRLKIYLN